MEENEGVGNGPSTKQLVLYAGTGLVAIVFFAWLLRAASSPVSDMPEVATTTATVATTTLAATTTSPAGPQPSSVSAPAPRKEFTFEIVATPALRSKGLSGRTDLRQDYGMLFVFPEKEQHGFWMKDMRTSIDIIWLSDTGTETVTVVGIEDSVSPDSYPKVFKAPEPVRYVLETRAGEARRQGWGVGTRLSLPSGIPVPQ